MMTQANGSRLSWQTVASRGAKTGVTLVAIYALAFAVYACVRSVWTVVSVLEPTEALRTAGAVIVSLIVPIIAVALMMALVAAILGAATAMIVYFLLPVVNPARRSSRATAVGIIASVIVAGSLYSAAQSLPGAHLAPAHTDAYLFWLVLPLSIYAGAGMIGARRLNQWMRAV